MSAAVIIGLPNIDPHKANIAGDQAKGKAIAENLIIHLNDQAISLKRFLADLVPLSMEGRQAFRVAVKNSLALMRAGTPDDDALKDQYLKALGSASVRMSEAVTFSRAIDAGFSPDMETETYHVIIAASRVFLASSSATGPTQRRGRKAAPILDKIKAYLEKNVKADEWSNVGELVATMVQLRTGE